VIRRLVAEAPQRLAPGGALVLETAGGEQARAVVTLMEAVGFTASRRAVTSPAGTLRRGESRSCPPAS